MNNQEILDKINEVFKSLTPEDLTRWSVKFFHSHGVTDLLAKNGKQTVHAANACVMKAVRDMSLGKIAPTELPSYTAELGIVTGVVMGVYVVAKSLGMEDQFIQDSPVTEDELNKILAKTEKAEAELSKLD